MTVTTIDPKRYVFQPGITQVLDTDDIDLDALGLHDMDGNAITEASLEGDADEAERTYSGLIPGGKSLSGDGTHSPRIAFVVSPIARDEIVRRAAAEKMSVSRWLRRVVERELSTPTGRIGVEM